MKSFKILTILLLSSAISFYSCNDSTKAPKQDSTKPIEVVKTPTQPAATTPKATPTEPAQNASGVWHYTCRIGCPGGAGSAAKCETCGNILAHNTAYHGSGSTNNTSSSPFANPAAATTPAAEPSQNSAGVWHYTCAKGCAGGAGSAGTCATCNGTLTHNSAYH